MPARSSAHQELFWATGSRRQTMSKGRGVTMRTCRGEVGWGGRLRCARGLASRSHNSHPPTRALHP
eukprot:scaffold3393_cov101-Isochrysis_galbana.AAC.9